MYRFVIYSSIFFLLLSLFLYESKFTKTAFFTSSFVYFIKPWAIALPIGIGVGIGIGIGLGLGIGIGIGIGIGVGI